MYRIIGYLPNDTYEVIEDNIISRGVAEAKSRQRDTSEYTKVDIDNKSTKPISL